MHITGSVISNLGIIGNILAALLYSGMAFLFITFLPRRYHPSILQLRCIYARQMSEKFHVPFWQSLKMTGDPDFLRQIAHPTFDPNCEEHLLHTLMYAKKSAILADRQCYNEAIIQMFYKIASDTADTTFHRDRSVQMFQKIPAYRDKHSAMR